MKKKKLNSKLFVKKSKIASLDQLNYVKGGENTIAPDRCDFIITMTCPTNGCPPTGGGTATVTCPSPTDDCLSANTFCHCDSLITMPGFTGC